MSKLYKYSSISSELTREYKEHVFSRIRGRGISFLWWRKLEESVFPREPSCGEIRIDQEKERQRKGTYFHMVISRYDWLKYSRKCII